MSYLLRFTGNYPPPLFALSFCHYCEHFYFYRFCSIGNERVVVEESSELRLSRGCVVINLLWFFTPLEPFHSYTNLMERAYISIFSIITKNYLAYGGNYIPNDLIYLIPPSRYRQVPTKIPKTLSIIIISILDLTKNN